MEEKETIKTIQEKQERLYEFPYHFLPVFDGANFKQHRTLVWGYEYLSYLNFIIEKIKLLNFQSLLDLGCGDGRFLFELNKKVKNKNLEGADYSENALFFARAFNPELKFYREDASTLESINKKFDVVTLIEVLEHIPLEKTKFLIEKIWRRLNNNGVLIISVPSDNAKINPKHCQHFNLAELKNIYEPYFYLEESFFMNKRGFLAFIVQKLFGNRLFLTNSQIINNFLYRYYVKRLLVAKEKNCKRIGLILGKNNNAGINELILK